MITTEKIKAILENALIEHQYFLNDAQKNQILRYLELVLEWNQKVNLTAHRNIEDLVYKDIMDQLLALSLLNPILQKCTSALDVGAGAGFTGILLSVLYPLIQTSFLDSDRKKLNFIRQCCLELKIKSYFHQLYLSEDSAHAIGPYSVILSRALTSVTNFQNYVQNYVQNSGYLIYMAGPSQNNEITEEHQNCVFEDELHYIILPYNYPRKVIIYRKK